MQKPNEALAADDDEGIPNEPSDVDADEQPIDKTKKKRRPRKKKPAVSAEVTSSPPASFAEGALAEIKGLQSRQDLNGRRVCLLHWDSSAGRWAVKAVGGADEKFKVKEDNMILLAADVTVSTCGYPESDLKTAKDSNSNTARVQPGTENEALETCFTIKEIEGKGWGVVAARDIVIGEMIIEEAPLLMYDCDVHDHFRAMAAGVTVPSFVNVQWKKLTEEQQAKVWALHDIGKEKTVGGILRTNALSRGYESTGSLICPTISRFNHSCVSNCQHAWDEEAKLERVFACTNIKAGDELCIYYINLFATCSVRKSELSMRYGFDCSCAACANPSTISDRRRTRIAQLDDQIFSVGAYDQKKALGLVEDLLELYEKEGIHMLSSRGRACYDAFQLSLAMRDLRKAKKWIERAYKYHADGEGLNNPTTREMAKYVQNPTSHRLWR